MISYLFQFSVLLFVVVVAEIVAGVYVFSTKDKIATNLQKEMNETLSRYNTDPLVTRSWNALQHDVSKIRTQKTMKRLSEVSLVISLSRNLKSLVAPKFF